MAEDGKCYQLLALRLIKPFLILGDKKIQALESYGIICRDSHLESIPCQLCEWGILTSFSLKSLISNGGYNSAYLIGFLQRCVVCLVLALGAEQVFPSCWLLLFRYGDEAGVLSALLSCLLPLYKDILLVSAHWENLAPHGVPDRCPNISIQFFYSEWSL